MGHEVEDKAPLTAEDDQPDDEHFEDHLVYWMTMPLWPILKGPPWIRITFAIWGNIGLASLVLGWGSGLPAWIYSLFVGPLIFIVLFGFLPMLLYAVLTVLLMPWHAPAPPEGVDVSLIDARVKRFRRVVKRRLTVTKQSPAKR